MKKIFTLALSALLALPALHADNAGQLPNNGFETGWATATPYSSDTQSITVGENPANWCISHVTGLAKRAYVIVSAGTGKKALGEKVSGYNSDWAVKVYNTWTGMSTFNVVRQVPGYVTLGTTWSTSQGSTTITNTDGGTFGGINFACRPDAITFMYQRGHGSGSDSSAEYDATEPATIVVYSWKGSWTQTGVPQSILATGTPSSPDMIDRDRCVLGLSLEGCEGNKPATPSEDAQLISKIIYSMPVSEDASEWTSFTMPLEYLDYTLPEDQKYVPEKFNCIFSANDYFNTSAVSGEGNYLTIDDVKLLYYSQLTDLKVNGTSVSGFAEDTYSYTIPYTGFSSLLPADASAFTYTRKGQSRTATVNIDIDRVTNHCATITVNNAEGADANGYQIHTYVLQFPTPYYSQLASLSVNGVAVTDFAEDTYNYTLSGLTPADASAFTYTTKAGSGTPTVDIVVDRANYKATITVKNAEGVDYDNVNTHTYTIQFDAPYYSQLASLKVNGEDVDDFAEDTYEYTVYGDMPTDDSAITYTFKATAGNPTATVALDSTAKTATITVTNPDGVDTDGLSSHVYIITFAEIPEQLETVVTYEGTLTIVMDLFGEKTDISPAATSTYLVHVVPEGGVNKCTFYLPNFSMPLFSDEPTNLGDIVIDKVRYTKNGDYITYKGQKENMILTPKVDEETATSVFPKEDDDNIVADCYLEGEQTSKGKAHFLIDVYWKMDEETSIPINVEFNGLINTGVKGVTVDESEAEVEYYNLQGIRIAKPQQGQIVIRRQGNNVTKIKL